MATWQLQTAKAKLSELLRAVREDGPQVISVRGEEEFVVMRKEEAPMAVRASQAAGAPKTLWELFEPLRQGGLGDELAASIEEGYRELRGGVREDRSKFERDE
jgi:prevent-host-death family protein